MYEHCTATRQQATREYKKALSELAKIGLSAEFRKRVESYANHCRKSPYYSEAVYYGNIAAYILSEKQDMINKHESDNRY